MKSWVEKFNTAAVCVPCIEESLLYLCIICTACIVWPCYKLGWDRITRFGKRLKNQNRSGIDKAVFFMWAFFLSLLL